MNIRIHLIISTIGFCLIANWLKTLVEIAVMLLTARSFHFKCSSISLLGFRLDLQDEKWVKSFQKLSLFFQYNLVIDASRPIPEDIDRKEKQLVNIRIASVVLVAVILLFLTRGSIMRIIRTEGSLLDTFLASIALGMLFHALCMVGISIYTYCVMMKKFGGYVDLILKRIRRGETFASLNLRPVNELPYKNPSKVEIMLYYNLYLYYLLETGQYEMMRQPIWEMTDYFQNRIYILQETLSYYWLIFYYSRFELNPELARLFLERVKDAILKDKDANAKRVLAYYAYGIERDIPKAKKLMDEGYMVLGKFSVGDEREIERRLLEELRGYITTAELNTYFGNW